ncbi:hypothetical protein PG984_012218 [Apiospora sp. TS-2023a]
MGYSHLRPSLRRDATLHDDSSSSQPRSTPNLAELSTAETTDIDTPQRPPTSAFGIEPPVTCRYCKHVFASQSLRRHIVSKHNFACKEGCDHLAFETRRDLERHYKTSTHRNHDGSGSGVAKSSAADYQCACGKLDFRKDLHKRHLQTCKKMGRGTFHCRRCDHHITSRLLHEAHLATCLKQRGRGRKSEDDK